MNLYRSTNELLEDGSFIVPRMDRKPLHSDTEVTNYFNIIAEIKFGIEIIRSKSLYCSTKINATKFYGANTYQLFPVEGTNYLYIANVPDSKVIVENALMELSVQHEKDSHHIIKTLKKTLTLKSLKKWTRVYDMIMHSLHENDHYTRILQSMEYSTRIENLSDKTATEIAIVGPCEPILVRSTLNI